MVRTEEIVKVVPEESTAVFRCIFKDELGASVVPTTLVWDLTALDGTVIAYNQTPTAIAATTYIPVFGSNTRILAGEESYGERLLTIRGTYNSTNGNNLPLHKQIKFRVQSLKLVGYPLNVTVIDVAFTDDYLQSVGVA